MKNKKIQKIFLGAGLLVCLTPFVGMAIAPTNTTTENRTLAEFPKLIDNHTWNAQFLSELGTYFEDHFALRNEMVAADSVIQAEAFATSSVGTVVKGTNGWLYYTDSLDNYLGKNTVTEQGAYNIARNINLVQEKLDEQGIQFYFTVAPNKNSLYSENMPYYDNEKASDTNNMDLVAPLLKAQETNYIDLYQVFEENQDILYRKQDSHWNGKGAVLAYNTLMDGMKKEHNDYSTTPILRTKSSVGDLAKALYSAAAQPEWDSTYQYDENFTFVNGESSWEEAWIQTQNEKAIGNLLMFRDSFGNTLSPLVAGAYANASFSKNTIYFLDKYVAENNPEIVLAEIVERNIQNFGIFDITKQNVSGPPIMQGPEATLNLDNAQTSDVAATVEQNASDLQPEYQMISGEVDQKLLSVNSNVYVELTSQGQSHIYEAYMVSKIQEDGTYQDNGYLLYLPEEQLSGEDTSIRIIVETNGTYTVTEQK